MTLDLSNYVRIGTYDLPEPTRTAAPVGNLLAQEVSAVTYNPDTDTLFVLGDGGTAIVEISKTGQLISTMTLAAGSSPQGTEFYDPEGLTYIGNGQFVLTEERDQNLVSFTYVPNTTLTRSATSTIDFGPFIGNVGFEGLTYDAQTGGFIVVKEVSPLGIFQTNVDFLGGTFTNAAQTDLFNPLLTNLADFADVYALSNVSLFDSTATSGNLIVLSQESGRIVEMDRFGNIISSLQLVSDPGNPLDIASQQHEGVTMDDQGYLYVVSENGGGDINHPQLWVFAPSLVANQAPTAIALINPTTALLENTSTAVPLKVASISITDDGIGANAYSLTGADAALFQVDATGLYIRAGVVLDYETQSSFNVTVNVDDPNVGASPDASVNYSLNLVDVLNEANGPTLIISEAAPWSSGNSLVAADWFEVTNTGTTAIDITGWKFDDSSASFAASVALNGVTSIGAGESVIFIEGGATQVANFISTWFGGTLPPGLQIGTYSGSGVGLSTGGDAVNLFNASGVIQANVSFGASPVGPTFGSFDNAAGINGAAISQLSVIGVNAAFAALAQASNVGSPGEISVNVTPLAADESLSDAAEDAGPITISFASLLGNDLAGPPNEASQTLTIVAVSGAVGGTAQIVGSDVVFTPTANFNGAASFAYTVEDNGQNYGVNAFLSDIGLASFTVTAVNDAPALTGTQSSNESGIEDTPFTVTQATLLTGFTDADGDVLAAINVTSSSGTVVDNGNGTWTVTPAANVNGTVTLSYDVSDGNGGTVAATLPYLIAATPDAPALTGAQAVLAAGAEDTAYLIEAAQFLQGFTDADGDTLSVSAVSASNGTVVDNGNGTWSVTPTVNFNGPVVLSYSVDDGNGGSAAGSLGYVLSAVNDAPTALALTNSTVAENRANNAVVGTLITTDVDNASGFTYTMLDGAGGRFYLNTAGAVLVGNGNLLDFEAATSHTITVRVTDAGGASYTQALTINLSNVVENQTYTGTAAANVFTAATPDNWTVDAKGGNDTITTLGGNDTIFAGGGNDTVSTGGGNDAIYFTGPASGFDAVDGGLGTDTILANSNNTAIGLSSIAGIEAITSNGFANVSIRGSTAANVLDFSGTTLTGITQINGNAGNDTIIGSAGADTIVGAAGRDTLSGGGGADTFRYNLASESTVANADHILDFAAGLDLIDLSAMDANAALAGNQAFTFIGTDDFTGLGQVRIGMSGGFVTLSGNTTGNLAPDFLIFLDSNPALTGADFVL